MFTGEFKTIALVKQAALDKRYQTNPERFVRGRPLIKMPPPEVVINPITEDDIESGMADQVNFPTLKAAGYEVNVH